MFRTLLASGFGIVALLLGMAFSPQAQDISINPNDPSGAFNGPSCTVNMGDFS